MSIRGWKSKYITAPRGQWSSIAQKKTGNPSRASQMANCRINPGVVESRPGTAAVFASTGAVAGIFNWVTPAGDPMVLYKDGDNIKRYRQNGGNIATLLAGLNGAVEPSFADLDVWVYFTAYDANDAGTIQAYVYDGVNTDKAFRGPIALTTASAVDGGAGLATAGTHYLGFVYQNRTGYAGIPTTSVDWAITATTNAAPDVLTAPGNNLVTGNNVTIAGATGDTAINGRRIVTVLVPGSTFTITDTDGNPINGSGAYSGSGILTVPLQITLSSNLRQVNISVTLPALSDGGTDAGGDVQATLFLIATRADNPANWYFIPDDSQTGQIGEQPVPYNTPTTLNFVFSISDEDMAASLDSANRNFLLIAQDSSGNGPFIPPSAQPFRPNFVVAYGLRMVYGNGTICYASDLNAPQQIAADTNQVAMPNRRNIAFAFQLPNSTDLYLTGDRWTARVTDNSDSPSTWAEPIKISDSLGAPYPACVCYKTGANNAWIATESGVYYFDGTYADIPLTYLISDVWKSVNWSQAQLFEIQDDVANLKLYVSVALYPSLVPTTIICFDYQNGKRYDQVDISIDSFHSKPTIGSIGVVKEFFTDISNLWIGPSAAGNVVRFDSTTHNDEGVLIDTFWISNLFLGTGEMTSQMIRVSAADVWVRGNGALLFVWRGPDNQALVTSQLMSAQGVIVPLSTTPGLTYQTKLDFTHIENFTFGLGTAAVDEWFSMSGFRPYYKPDLYNR